MATELICEYDPQFHSSGKKPPKGVLNWVGQPRPGEEPVKIEARLYNLLFTTETPGDTWLQEINPESEVIVRGAMGNPTLASAKVHWQFYKDLRGNEFAWI